MTCPVCAAELTTTRCECGYDVREAAYHQMALARHLQLRTLGVFATGVALIVLLAALHTTLMPFAMLAAFAAPGFAVIAHMNARATSKRLHHMRSPAPLPEARLR